MFDTHLPKKRDLVVLTDMSLITCVVQKDHAERVVNAARKNGAQGATVYYARGTGIREQLGLLSIAVDAEKEVVEVIVSKPQGDHVFQSMFEAGKLATPGMGIIYMTHIEKAATYIPPNVLATLV